MIMQLRGMVTYKALQYAVIDTNGVGYKVFATPDTISKLAKGTEATLWTHLAVRENAMDLYGFPTRADLEFFELLIGVSGVGPKSALSILMLADTETLKSAIASGDTSYLTKVSGIGQKSSKKIVLELQDKIGATEQKGTLKEDADVLDALITMGYSQGEAREALKQIPRDIPDARARLKEALKLLGNGNRKSAR
ncbi:MAG: Holliday junction branch migration protein RuvA [bacterium]|nr:Holliday junction branch migration protein RuvA [bacterium]